MLEIEWENPRFELPKKINLNEYPNMSVGEILVQLQNQFYHSIQSYNLVQSDYIYI